MRHTSGHDRSSNIYLADFLPPLDTPPAPHARPLPLQPPVKLPACPFVEVDCARAPASPHLKPDLSLVSVARPSNLPKKGYAPLLTG